MTEKFLIDIPWTGEKSTALLPYITEGEVIHVPLSQGDDFYIAPFYNRYDLSIFGIITIWRGQHRNNDDEYMVFSGDYTKNRFKFFNDSCPSYMVATMGYCEDAFRLDEHRLEDLRRDGVFGLMGFGDKFHKFKAELHFAGIATELVILRDEDVPDEPSCYLSYLRT